VKRIIFAFVISLSLIAVSLASPETILIASAQAVGGPRKGGILISGLPADPATLNPGMTTSIYSHTCADGVFNSLLETQLDLSVRPGLAEKWEVSSDGLTYTFYLVKNATWHDGKRFTSADVKFTFEQILIPFHPQGKVSFGVIQSIETPDDFTVRFKLGKLWPAFIPLLGSTYTAPILSKSVYEGTDILQNPANWKPVGTGAFKFVEYVKGDRVVLERNPNYWRAGKPYLDKLIVKIVPSLETAVLAFQAGEIDYLGYWVTYDFLKRLEGPTVTITFEGSNALAGVSWLYFNLDHPILKTLKVRQAIAHAIDRNKISEVVRLGHCPVAVGPVHEATKWAYDPNLQPSYAYDPKKAEQLLDEAGFPRKEGGIRFKLNLNGMIGQYWNVYAEMIAQEYLKAVGIEVNHQTLALGTADQLLFTSREFDLAVRRFSLGPSTEAGLMTTFASDQVGKGSYTNAMNYRNPRAEALLVQSQTESDPAKRRQLILEWQSIIMTDLPGLPLLQEYFFQAYKKDWVGIPCNPYSSQTMFAENVWWTKGTLIEVPKTTTTATTVAQAAPDMTGPAVAVAVVAIIAAVGLYMMRKKQTKPKAS